MNATTYSNDRIRKEFEYARDAARSMSGNRRNPVHAAAKRDARRAARNLRETRRTARQWDTAN